MTTVTMPETVAYLSCCPETGRPEWSESCVCEDAVFTVEETGTISRAVVFQDDLEAYANARVRELAIAARKLADWAEHDVGAWPVLTPGLKEIRDLIQKDQK